MFRVFTLGSAHRRTRPVRPWLRAVVLDSVRGSSLSVGGSSVALSH